MSTTANVVVGLIAVLHVYILVLEMFLWDKPRGLRAFGQTPEAAKASKVLAANQGLYNGFLAAGLFWGLALGAVGPTGKGLFPRLRAGGRSLRRGDRQPADSVRPGPSRGGRARARAPRGLTIRTAGSEPGKRGIGFPQQREPT